MANGPSGSGHPTLGAGKSGGSSSNVGPDTFIDIPNANNIEIPTAEFRTTQPVNTPGAESGKFEIDLVTLGAQPNSGVGDAAVAKYGFEPATMRIDIGTVLTIFNMMLRQNGVDVASIGFNSVGQLILTASQAAGGLAFKTGPAGQVAADANLLAFLGASVGLKMSQVPIQERQAINTASANNLTLPQLLSQTAGNAVNITGSTQINLIQSSGWQNGYAVDLLFPTGCIIKNNQAPSGTLLPILTKSGIDIPATANMRVRLRLMGGNSGTAAVAWYEF